MMMKSTHTIMSKIFSVLLLLVVVVENLHAFQQRSGSSLHLSSFSNNAARKITVSTTRRYSFFKDVFEKAFENDQGLAQDKSKGQYDDMMRGEEYIENDNNSLSSQQLTETQRKWREAQQMSLSSTTTTTKINVLEELLQDTQWKLDLYLSGVPERDPSNDLYGSKVNISSRDKSTGLALPSNPSTTITIQFLNDGICKAESGEFTGSGDVDGEWKLSDDNTQLRFSINGVGYTKTVETRGSIQNVYWTDEEEKTVETSTTYNIPPGFVYCDIGISQGRQPGTIDLGGSGTAVDTASGVIRVEQSSGLFGISSKMVACGKFDAKQEN